MGIFNAKSSPMMMALYAIVLLERPLVREKEYGIKSLFTETNKISITTMLSYEFSFLSIVVLL